VYGCEQVAIIDISQIQHCFKWQPKIFSSDVVSAIWFSADSKVACCRNCTRLPVSQHQDITGSDSIFTVAQSFLRSVQRGLCRFFLSLRDQQSIIKLMHTEMISSSVFRLSDSDIYDQPLHLVSFMYFEQLCSG